MAEAKALGGGVRRERGRGARKCSNQPNERDAIRGGGVTAEAREEVEMG